MNVALVTSPKLFALDLASTYTFHTPQRDSQLSPTHVSTQHTTSIECKIELFLYLLRTQTNNQLSDPIPTPTMRYSFQAVICLVFVFGISIAGAWKAEFFSEELGCGDADASTKSTSLEYVGPDLNDTLIPQLMPCLDLGAAIEDPLVNCTVHPMPSDAASTETGDVSDTLIMTYLFFSCAYQSVY